MSDQKDSSVNQVKEVQESNSAQKRPTKIQRSQTKGFQKKTLKEQELEKELEKSYNNVKDVVSFKKVIKAQNIMFNKLDDLPSQIQSQYVANQKKIEICFEEPLQVLKKKQVKVAKEKRRNLMKQSDPRKQYLRHLGIMKRTMTLVTYTRSVKCLKLKKRLNNDRKQLKDRKEKLKKILKVNLRISAYMTKLKEQFMNDIQNQKGTMPSDTTFLTLADQNKREYKISTKFYSQEYKRPQNNPFKKVSRKSTRFKFQLPKLRLSIYNEVTKDAIKMMHPNIHTLTTKARRSIMDSTLLEENTVSSQRNPRNYKKKRMSLGGLNRSSYRYGNLKPITGDLTQLSVLHKQYHQLKRKNSQIMASMTRGAATFNISFQQFKDIFHFYYNYIKTGFNFQENEFQKISFIKPDHAHYSKKLNQYIYDSNDPYNDVVEEFTEKHLKSYEDVNLEKSQSQIIDELIIDQKKKQKEQRQFAQEMNIFEFRLKAAIRNQMFDQWKDKQHAIQKILNTFTKIK